MHHFRYTGPNLHCESVDLAEVARLYGTPTYVYSAATMEDNYRRLQRGLTGLDVQICFAMKANSNTAVLRHFANLGAAFDLVSGGELRRVLVVITAMPSSYIFCGYMVSLSAITTTVAASRQLRGSMPRSPGPRLVTTRM